MTAPVRISVLVTPYFNLAATTAFIDPFRVANYLSGKALYSWSFASLGGGPVAASNGMTVETARATRTAPQFGVVSSSWTPEAVQGRDMSDLLSAWARGGARMIGLDTGAFVLAGAGLLKGRRATVHYEHIDALAELYPDTQVTEALYEVDGARLTCAGGTACTDLALELVRDAQGAGLANRVARYVFHHTMRGPETTQNPARAEPFGPTAPRAVRRAIDVMEAHLEAPLTVPQVCAAVGVSQRQLGRLFREHVRKSPVQYYRDIRLDRARGLVTQTDLRLSEIAVAAGFSSQVHFARAYHARFGLPPIKDRTEGRVPFEFRAWPMHPGAGRG